MLAGRVIAGEPRLTGGLVVVGLGAQTCFAALATRCVAGAWRHSGRISMARGYDRCIWAASATAVEAFGEDQHGQRGDHEPCAARGPNV